MRHVIHMLCIDIFFREIQIRNDVFSNNVLPFPKKKNLSEIFDKSTQPNNHIFVLWSTDLDTSTFKEFESWIVWQFYVTDRLSVDNLTGRYSRGEKRMNFYLKSHYFSIMYLLVWIFPIYRAKQNFFFQSFNST